MRYSPVVLSANGRVKPDVVLIDGREERHPERAYYIEWYEGSRRRRLSVGKNAADAHARRLAKEAELNAANQGVPLAKSEQNGHTSLTAAVADYLERNKAHEEVQDSRGLYHGAELFH